MQNAADGVWTHLQNAATQPGGFADATHANAAPCQGGGPAQKVVDFSRNSSLNATAGLILVGTTDPRVLRPQRQAIRPDRPVVRRRTFRRDAISHLSTARQVAASRLRRLLAPPSQALRNNDAASAPRCASSRCAATAHITTSGRAGEPGRNRAGSRRPIGRPLREPVAWCAADQSGEQSEPPTGAERGSKGSPPLDKARGVLSTVEGRERLCKGSGLDTLSAE